MQNFSALTALQKLINSVLLSSVSKSLKYLLWQLCCVDYWTDIS